MSGAHMGYVVEVLLELGYDAYGCDISFYAVNKANELHKWKRCFVVDICKEPLVEKYHLITMFNTIEHLYDIESTLLNVKTSLYSGGTLLVQTVNPLNLFILLDKDPTHINIHSPVIGDKSSESSLNMSSFGIINTLWVRCLYLSHCSDN